MSSLFSSSAADSETSSMVKFMFKVQARNTSGKAKKKGGDKFEVFVAGPDVLLIHSYTFLCVHSKETNNNERDQWTTFKCRTSKTGHTSFSGRPTSRESIGLMQL